MSNFREKAVARARADIVTALSNGDFDIIHNVNVHQKLGEDGRIDYNDEKEEFVIKTVRFTRKKNKDGGYLNWIKIIVE